MSTTLPSVLEKVWDTVSQTPYAADALATAWSGWKSWSVDLGDRLDERYRVAGPALSTESESPESGAPRGG